MAISPQQADTQGSPSPNVTHPSSAPILVCGLGSLGQSCVGFLKDFGVPVSGIEIAPPNHWELPTLPTALDRLWVGDCRQPEILKQAGIQGCRSVLLVTGNERVNVEAAFAARLLNPEVRLIVRSSKQNLNSLLEQQLGNYVAFEPTQLSVGAFAFAALDEEVVGFFSLEGRILQINRRTLRAEDPWVQRRQMHEIDSRVRRLLLHRSSVPTALSPQRATSDGRSPQPFFYRWKPNDQPNLGDILYTIEDAPLLTRKGPYTPRSLWKVLGRFGWSQRVSHPQAESTSPDQENASFITGFWPRLRHLLRQIYRNQVQRVALLCGLTVVGLLLMGTIFLWARAGGPVRAFYATVVLLLGGYGDLFGNLEEFEPQFPEWLRFFSLMLTVAGTAFVGVLYALLTESLLTLRLQFLNRRPPIPERDHVVVIGLGRVGQRVAALLQDFKQMVVGVTDQPDVDTSVLPDLSLVTGKTIQGLSRVNLATAKSVVAVTEDELDNLEMGLMAHATNPNINLVVRTYSQHFSDQVSRLFPYAHVACVSTLAAEAFVAAAFGEKVLSLFRIEGQTILVTDYSVEEGDTLNGLLLAEVAYGYSIIPICHERLHEGASTFMPSGDVRLQRGDRLVVLATIRGLQRVENGELLPRLWQVRLERAYTKDGEFEGANTIARISGCPLNVARDLMGNLPAVLPCPLYEHQAFRLARYLGRAQVLAHAEMCPP